MFLLVLLPILTACTSASEIVASHTPVSTYTYVVTADNPAVAYTETTLPVIPSDTSKPSTTMTPQATRTRMPTLMPTPTLTLEPMSYFTTTLLRDAVIPQTYIEDVCTYLARRWAVDGSPPGTIVLPIMFHSIYRDGRVVNDPKEISVSEFESLISTALRYGFKTITTEELQGYLEHNAKIPPLSMLMVVDDRRPGLIQERFMPVLEANDWTVTSAYITDPDSLGWAWEIMDQLIASGRVDIQSHGYSGQLYIVDQTSEEDIRQEIERSTVVLEERYGTRPIAFIWPGGNFTPLAVKIARQDGYQLGFTAYSRGPLMYNWIPLGEEERSIGDPLMVLPRAWSNSAIFNMEQAIEISEKAREHAQNNYALEARWYAALCGGELPVQEGFASPPSP